MIQCLFYFWCDHLQSVYSGNSACFSQAFYFICHSTSLVWGCQWPCWHWWFWLFEILHSRWKAENYHLSLEWCIGLPEFSKQGRWFCGTCAHNACNKFIERKNVTQFTDSVVSSRIRTNVHQNHSYTYSVFLMFTSILVICIVSS